MWSRYNLLTKVNVSFFTAAIDLPLIIKKRTHEIINCIYFKPHGL